MMVGGSNGYSSPRLPWWARLLCALPDRPWLLTGSVGAVVVGLGAYAAWGGCSWVPLTPLLERRDAVCAAVGLEADCFLRPMRVTDAVITSTETTWTIRVSGDVYGPYAITPAEHIADPGTLTLEAVERRIRFLMGPPALQSALRSAYKLPVGSAAYLDHVADLIVAPGLATTTADVLVVTR